MKKLVLFLLIATACAGSIYIHLKSSSDTEAPSNFDSSSQAHAPQITKPPVISVHDSLGAKANVSVLLGAQGENARTFIHKNLQKATEGGYYRGLQAAKKCNFINTLTPLEENTLSHNEESNVNYAQRLKAFNDIKTWCEGIDNSFLKDILESPAQENDPVYKSVRAYASNMNNPILAQTALIKAIEIGGAPVVDEIGQRLIPLLKTYTSPPLPTQDLLASIYILPCLIGGNCTSDELEIKLECALNGICYSNRLDKMRREMCGGSADCENNAKNMANRVRILINSNRLGELIQ